MKALLRLFWLALAAALLLQLFFVARIAAMAVLDPGSTSFERTEAWRLAQDARDLKWSQQWQPYERISPALKRAVIASEDAGFMGHGGVQWQAIEKAYARNQTAEEKAEKADDGRPVKIYGGSTITQQLAKNLLLSGERSLLRKGQELVLTMTLEAFLSKRRILEIYLNNVEWGEGIFGAEAAAQRYFGKSARQLSAREAARLAVMLPAPKRFEQRVNSRYLNNRASTIAARMNAVTPP